MKDNPAYYAYRFCYLQTKPNGVDEELARKIKFGLEMSDGTKVRGSLEELRENFDIEKAMEYFISGKLAEWLKDRYYEDEAAAIEAIDKDAPDLRQRLCKILGVEYEGDEEFDVEALERLNEKKAILRQKTGDDSIISNAVITALTQEDLAYLLDMDESVIYLCGEEFTVPARIKNKHYIGILGVPKINITVKSEEELNDKDIIFDNVQLPWTKEEEKIEAVELAPVFISPEPVTANEEPAVEDESEVSELIEIFNSVFTAWHPKNEKDIWEYEGSSEELSAGKKKIALRLICKNKYKEADLVHLKITSDMSAGWAVTKDSVCFGGKIGNIIVNYEELCDDGYTQPISMDKDFKSTFSFDEIYKYTLNTNENEYELCQAINNEGIEIMEYDMEELNTYLMTVSRLFSD